MKRTIELCLILLVPMFFLVSGCQTLASPLTKQDLRTSVICTGVEGSMRGAQSPDGITDTLGIEDSVYMLSTFSWTDGRPRGPFRFEHKWYSNGQYVTRSGGQGRKGHTPYTVWGKNAAFSLGPGIHSVELYVEERLIDRKEFTVASAKQRAEIHGSGPDADPSHGQKGVAGTGRLANRWAVVVGISKYQHVGHSGLSDLPFAQDDARMFARWLLDAGWSRDHIKCITNENATERNIRIVLESWLTKASRDDVVVLYWAGHGFPDPEDPQKVYFACYDTDVSIPATGYRMDRIRRTLGERNARNVIVLADTCHAGKLITRGERGLSVIPRIKRMQEQNQVPKGWVFMVAADTDRKAVEHSSWRNGAFTHCLLQGLSGKADGFQSVAPKDGTVTLGELREYLRTAMPDETQKVLGVAKHPLITTSSGDPSIWNLTLQGK